MTRTHRNRAIGGGLHVSELSYPVPPKTAARLLMLLVQRRAVKHPVLIAADLHESRVHAAVRYALGRGKRQLPNADRAASAIKAALLSVLPKVLLDTMATSGNLVLNRLSTMKVAG